MVKRIYLDIETLPPDESSRARITVGMIRKLDRHFVAPERRDDERCNDAELRRLALFAEYGRVLCIGMIIECDGTPARSGVLGFDRRGESLHPDEGRTLRQFWKLLEGFNTSRDLIIGHNALDFDLPFIYNRSRINRVRPSVRLSFARYRSQPIYDTMREWANWNPKANLSLRHLSEVLRLGLSKSDDFGGGKVYDAYLAGHHQAIADYCLQDVVVTRAAYYRLTQPDCDPPALPAKAEWTDEGVRRAAAK